jgi:hypothetical protein
MLVSLVRLLRRHAPTALLIAIACAAVPVAEARPRDSDGDGLKNRFERKRSHTNPRRADTDRDRLRDGAELRRFRTNPRKADTDGDGMKDGREVRKGRNPRRGPRKRRKRASGPPLWSCDVNAGSASELRSAVGRNPGKTVCVSGSVGDVSLAGVRPSSPVTVAPAAGGGDLGDLNLTSAANIQVLALRMRSALIAGSSSTPAQNLVLRACRAGGSGPSDRADVFALIDVRSHTDGLTVDGCDLGWTTSVGADNDTGFGFRLSVGSGEGGEIRNITLRGNRLHHLACDALQMAGVAQLNFDRNEIAYVASDGTDLHADSIQILSLAGDPEQIRFTNNYIHHTGFLEPGRIPPGGAAGQWLWHDYDPTGALVENNLIVDNRNYAPYWTGVPSNVTLRRNTIVRNGLAFGSNSPDMQWESPGGPNRVAEQNIIGAMGGGQGVAFSGNVFIDQNGRGPSDIRRSVAFDANGNPKNLPKSHANAGFRKPRGVPW